MKLPLQITFRNFPASPALEAAITERAGRLEQFASDLMRCHVTVELVDKHKHQGRQYMVRIDITLSGTELVISRDHAHEDVAVALRDAFNAAARKLEDYVRVRRGDVKTHQPPTGERSSS